MATLQIPSRFNLRVYGLWMKEDAILLTKEKIRGREVLKFPGGGLELGEGLADGLKREFMEELGVSITVHELFYVNDFFVPSAFDDSQVLSFYYRVSAADQSFKNLVAEEWSFWKKMVDLNEDEITLPIDKVVAALLKEKS